MKIGCLSDLHLKPGASHHQDARLYATLVNLVCRCDQVVIVGDLLEMYTRVGSRKAHFKKIARAYPRAFDFISRNTNRIVLINGNHDDGCLGMIPGARPVASALIDGYYFIHGHQADVFFASKQAEQFVEAIIRGLYRLESWMMGVTRFKFSEGFAVWQHRNHYGSVKLRKTCLDYLSSVNRQFIAGVVAGHTHIKDGCVMRTGQRYFNTGTFMDGNVLILDTSTGKTEWP